jgi:hypothetical protein
MFEEYSSNVALIFATALKFWIAKHHSQCARCGIAPPYRRTHGVVLFYRPSEHRYGCVCKAGP